MNFILDGAYCRKIIGVNERALIINDHEWDNYIVSYRKYKNDPIRPNLVVANSCLRPADYD